MNILGEGFPNEICEQVKIRQQVYGSGYNSLNPRTPEEIIYLNANTSWVKLASSVNIKDPKIIQNKSLADLGDDIKDNKLAKKFVLFNGVNEDPSNQRAGIALNQDILGNNNAYGIGGTEFGLRPMMGIISADITHENRGSIRRATIKVKAFNKVQFDIIDVLYLRLGFNVLLEWGHSMYFDNNGVLQKGIDNSLVSKFLNPSGVPIFTPGPQGNVIGGTTSTSTSLTYQDFLKLIDNQRKISNGNYDAMFGKVSNFHWSFLPDGSYDITIDLVSVGDIIESFKINTLINSIDTSVKAEVDKTKKDPSQMESKDVIALYANQSQIGQHFWELVGPGISKKQQDEAITEIGGFLSSDFLLTEEEKQARSRNINKSNKDTINITYTGDNTDTIYYIRLGAFLDFIQTDLMYYVKTSGNKTEATLKFDTEVETNLMYIEPLQVSTDPTVCVVRRNILINKTTFEIGVGNGGVGELFESSLFTDQPNPYGQIMNIYVSMKFILIKLNELKDANTNKVVLIEFLNNILSAINSSLGGISKLEATLFNESTVVIRDGNPLPNIQKVIEVMKDKNISKSKFDIYDKYAQFDLYGYSTTNPPNSTIDYEGKGHASFIKDFSFTTEISPELATMITVGATANSTVVGENSTAFSKFNAGLEDRYKEKIVYVNADGTSDTGVVAYAPPEYSTPEARTKTVEEQEQTLLYKELYLKYASVYNNYCDYIKRLSGTNPTYNGEADTYKDALNNFITFKQQADFTYWALLVKNNPTKYAIPEKFTPSTGFIPFNMSLTMDGLSGMRIYSKFLIDTSYLPANYPNNASFLIKNINHNISNNKWTTKLESIVISQGGDINTSASPDILPTGQNTNTSQPTPMYTPSTYTPRIWSNKLREIITQLGYTEKGNEIDNGGDISERLYNAASEILKNIKTQLPTLKIQVTGGNDSYHQKLNSNSKHKEGNGLDFTLSSPTPANLDKVINILKVYRIKNLSFSYIDEYRNPSSQATAGHIHIQIN